jgi:predicted DNA-binding protein (MmcQ/YjbR family)
VTLDALRRICRALPGTTEDVKWEKDLCFCVGGKMFAAVNLEAPHQLGFKCTSEAFGELTEREGIIPAPYLARAMWVQEQFRAKRGAFTSTHRRRTNQTANEGSRTHSFCHPRT